MQRIARPRHTRLAHNRSRQLRGGQTISEARLWSRLRSRQLGARFRRQVPIGIWIVDFACLDPKIVIEVDGASHHYRDESERTEYLKAQGFLVLRFTNKEVAMEFDSVVKTVESAIR